MKKIFLSVLLIIFLIAGVFFFVAFTASGNALMLPYINGYLKENVQQANVELIKLELKPNYLSAVTRVNESIEVVSSGPIDLLSKSFDLDYTIDAKKIQTEGFSVDRPLHVQGKAKGKPEDMYITGKGNAFDSTINYELAFYENQPQNIKLHLVDASLAEILAIAGQKPYMEGDMSVEVDMPVLDPENPKGTASLKIRNGVINAAVVNQEHNLSLASDQSVKVDMNASANGKLLKAQGDIISDLGKIVLRDTRYHLSEEKLDMKYLLDIADMTKLASLLHRPFKGKMKISGSLSRHKDSISISANTRSLGGKSSFVYDKDTLNATFLDVQAQRVLGLIGEPKYVNGKMSGSLSLESIENLSGKFDLKGSGRANRPVVQKELDINLGKQFDYQTKISGKIKDNRVSATSRLQTTMGTLVMPDITYDSIKSILRSSYTLSIEDLGKLQPLTKRRFRGDMAFKGGMTFDKDLVITGEGKEFGGSVNYKLVNSNINADVKGATVSKVMYMLGYPQILEALTQAKIVYDFTTKRGTVDATLDTAQLLSTQYTLLLKQLLKIDLTKEIYSQATFNSSISPARFDFNFNAQNPVSHIKVQKGTLDRKSDRLNIPVDLRYKNKDLKGRVTGTLKKPKVTLDTSAYLKSKVDKKVDKLLDDKLKDKGGEQIKGLLKGFLK